jgi:hypothetical protein
MEQNDAELLRAIIDRYDKASEMTAEQMKKLQAAANVSGAMANPGGIIKEMRSSRRSPESRRQLGYRQSSNA